MDRLIYEYLPLIGIPEIDDKFGRIEKETIGENKGQEENQKRPKK